MPTRLHFKVGIVRRSPSMYNCVCILKNIEKGITLNLILLVFGYTGNPQSNVIIKCTFSELDNFTVS